MFVLEKVSENDKELYEKICKRSWFEELSTQCADRERGYYIICTEKRGVETPYYFYMNYKDEVIEIWVWDLSDIYRSDGFEDIVVWIPDSLSNDTDDIARIIRNAHSDNAFSNCSSMMWQAAQIKDIRFKIKEKKL